MGTEIDELKDSFRTGWIYAIFAVVAAGVVVFLAVLGTGQVRGVLAFGICAVIAPAYGVIAWMVKIIFDMRDVVLKIDERLGGQGK